MNAFQTFEQLNIATCQVIQTIVKQNRYVSQQVIRFYGNIILDEVNKLGESLSMWMYLVLSVKLRSHTKLHNKMTSLCINEAEKYSEK